MSASMQQGAPAWFMSFTELAQHTASVTICCLGFSQACLMLQAALQLQKERAEQVAVAMQSFLMDFQQLYMQRRTCLAALQEASQLVPALLVSG